MARYTNKKTTNETREPVPPTLIAYHVTEARKEGDKGFWTRIGAAWDHKDGGGMTLQLDLVPVAGGRIVLRVPAEQAAPDNAETGDRDLDDEIPF
jgi:hypothetical protein